MTLLGLHPCNTNPQALTLEASAGADGLAWGQRVLSGLGGSTQSLKSRIYGTKGDSSYLEQQPSAF